MVQGMPMVQDVRWVGSSFPSSIGDDEGQAFHI